MTEILKDRTNRVLIAFGMYLLYETVNKIIDSDYNLKTTYDDKSIVLQKQTILSPKRNDSNIEQNT